MLKKVCSLGYLMPALLLFSMTSMAADHQPLVVEAGMPHSGESRVKASNNSMLEMLGMLEQLQQDMRMLRGEIEVQSNQVQQIQKRQRDLYVDIDRRLRGLEIARTNNKEHVGSPAVAEGITDNAVTSKISDHKKEPQKIASTRKDDARNELYDHALGLLREARYDEAAVAFRRVLIETPESIYADNAQYWLAETFYVTRKFEQALKAFQTLLDKYKDSNKRADAYLKMGYIHYELKNDVEARAQLNQVVKLYAGTTAARLAEGRLRRMKHEGR